MRKCLAINLTLLSIGVFTPLFAFTLVEISVVTGILASVPKAQYGQALAQARQTEVTINLKQVYQCIVVYEASMGALPEACFYPEDARSSPKSILKILELPEKLLVNPALPESLVKRGLTYVWNEKVGGKALSGISEPAKTWLLADMTVISADIPGPNQGKYNVLWADGSVGSVDSLPDIERQSTHGKKKNALAEGDAAKGAAKGPEAKAKP